MEENNSTAAINAVPSLEIIQSAPARIEFPRSAMIGYGGEFASLYSPGIECPEAFLFMAFNTCLGAACSNNVSLDLPFSCPPNLYTCLLGETANPRKSTSIKLPTNFFSHLDVFTDDRDRPFRTENGLGSAEGFIRTCNGWNKKDEPDKRPVLLVYDELQAFVDKANQKGSILLPMIATLFESDSYDGTTVKRQVNLRDCHLSMLGASTIDTYGNMWTSEFTSIGFPNRLFIVVADRDKMVAFPKFPPSGPLSELKQRVCHLLAKIKEGEIKMSLAPDAAKLWEEYYLTIDYRSIHARRLDAIGFRLMQILSLGKDERYEVSRETVEAVTQLLDYELQVRKLYDPINADNKVAKMEENIRRVLSTRSNGDFLTERFLKQYTHANRCGLWFFGVALSNLQKLSGEVEKHPTEKAYRLIHE